jgi:uncharacterized protein (TIGR02145 family)
MSKFSTAMKNHLNYCLMSMVVLLNLMMILTTCKKKCGTPLSASTNSASSITQSKATLNGVVNTDGPGLFVVTFEFGKTSSYGEIYGTDFRGGNGYIPTQVHTYLTWLSANTTYHYRIKAVSSCQTTYGKDVSFTTLNIGESGIIFNPNLTYGSAKDNDGNNYKTIQIGIQTWMAENLKTTKFNDGTAIPLEVHNQTWATLTTSAFCWYNNDSSTYKSNFGALYNWYAVNTSKLCPIGWHVPTDAEWTILMTYLGGINAALGNLQEVGTTNWLSQNPDATNGSGFTALPSGYRYNIATSDIGIGYLSYWWSSTECSTNNAWNIYIYYSNNFGSLQRLSDDKRDGNSVRCLMDL